MAKENNEPKPALNLDGKEYQYDDLTDYQKSIVADIEQYRIQIVRLQRWESGQIMVLRQTFVQKEQEEEKEPELVEEEESADDFTRYQESEVEA